MRQKTEVRSQKTDEREKNKATAGKIIRLIGMIGLMIGLIGTAGAATNNPYPKTGSESDRELIQKHEKALTKIFDGGATLSSPTITGGLTSLGTITGNLVGNVTGTATNATNATNADTLDNLHAADLFGALVFDYTVAGAAVQTLNIPDLTGLAHGGYLAEFMIINSNATTASNYTMEYNGDTTTTDYYSAQGATASGNNPSINHTSYALAITTFGYWQLAIMAGNNKISSHLNYSFPAYGAMWYHFTKPSVAFSDLTSILIRASVSSGIGIGSRFRLWRRK